MNSSGASRPGAKFAAIKRQPVRLPEEFVKTSFLNERLTLPLVVTPLSEDVEVEVWSANNRKTIDNWLTEHGAILFRGFKINSVQEFERFSKAVIDDLFSDNGEHTRKSVSGSVYTPVFYPAERQLLWHNENSFNQRWPAKIAFCCLKPPASGGETPIVDSRAVYRLTHPRVREAFEERSVMYVRNYGDGLGLDWKTVMRVETRDEAERYCKEYVMQYEWKPGDKLRTRSVRPAVIQHPVTGEKSWFNQAQHWHVSCLDQETRTSLSKIYSQEDLPRNCYYGDGSQIEDGDMQSILDIYKQQEVVFPWKAGDILLLDNIMTAHGRNAFEGERQLLVAMGEMRSF